VTALYIGTRIGAETLVTVNGEILPPRLDLVRHSPTGLEWGYGGSGPAQLALAILAHHTGNAERAVQLHQAFKWDVVAKLERLQWIMTGNQVEQWLKFAAAHR